MRTSLPRWHLPGILTAPAAPVAAAWLSYLVHHPPRVGRGPDPARSRLAPTRLRIPVTGRERYLDGWLLAGDPRRVVVVGHSLGADKSRSLSYAKFLLRAGYTVVLFDFRNHGESFSDRALTGFSGRFADDVVAVVDHVRGRPGYARAEIALYGLSLSSFAVLHAVARLGPLAAIVCDGGPTSDPSMTVRNLVRSGMLPRPAAMLTPQARGLFEAVFHRLAVAAMSVPRDWPPAGDRAGYGTTPMLFVIGDADEVVGAEEVCQLARLYPRARVAVVPGARHLGTMAADRDGYRARVLGFLAETLGSAELPVSPAGEKEAS